MSVPTFNPAMLANIKKRQVAEIEPDIKGKLVRPGFIERTVNTIHDGVVKTKHLEAGMTVRPYLHGAPRGGERVVKSVKRIDDGAMCFVEWDSAHVDAEFKAAYRWYCEALDGATVERTVKQPGLVPYQEV